MDNKRRVKRLEVSKPVSKLNGSQSNDNGTWSGHHVRPGCVNASVVRFGNVEVAYLGDKSEHLELRRVRRIPRDLNRRAVEDAVQKFVFEIDLNTDPIGTFNETIKKIASSTFLNSPGMDFWMAKEHGEVKAYALAHVTNAVDDRLTYWISQAWAGEDLRHTDFANRCWDKLKDRAIRLHCAHIVMVSSRKGWMRYLKDGVHEYATLLKKDLED